MNTTPAKGRILFVRALTYSTDIILASVLAFLGFLVPFHLSHHHPLSSHEIDGVRKEPRDGHGGQHFSTLAPTLVETDVGRDKDREDYASEGKVLRVLLSGRWLPRNQG